MSAFAAAEAVAPAGPRLATESLRSALLWLMAFAGGFVFVEPGPYEVVGLATLFFFVVTGLSLRPTLALLLLLLIVLNVGYAVSLLQVIGQAEAVIWTLVSVFLAATAIFFAAMLGSNTERRLHWLVRGYIAASVIVSLIAVAGYFHSLGGLSDMFVIFGRAKGTFKDPNVFGAFLILPCLFMVQRILAGRRSAMLSGGMLLIVLMGGLFLSFSRAAWGQFVLGTLILMALSYLTSRSPSERLRIVVVAIVGMFLVVLLVAALLSFDTVAELFRERATLTQSYDTGHSGRFGRYLIALQLILDRPFGMGPLQFLFPEAPHNTYLNSFIVGGWLAGFAYLAITLVTLVVALRFVFIATPWRPTFVVFYAAYVAVAAESAIIDSDHWRHYFLILGVLWGLMAVTRGYRQAARTQSPR